MGEFTWIASCPSHLQHYHLLGTRPDTCDMRRSSSLAGDVPQYGCLACHISIISRHLVYPYIDSYRHTCPSTPVSYRYFIHRHYNCRSGVDRCQCYAPPTTRCVLQRLQGGSSMDRLYPESLYVDLDSTAVPSCFDSQRY